MQNNQDLTDERRSEHTGSIGVAGVNGTDEVTGTDEVAGISGISGTSGVAGTSGAAKDGGKVLMKKTLLVGRHGVGKTTLKQALKGEEIHYVKTQYMEYGEWLIDSPGEYAEVHGLNAAIAVYSYESDVVAMLIAADDDYSLFPPNCASMINRDVIGIVTKIDKCPPDKAADWLRLSGCKRIFAIDSHSGKGVDELREYLRKQ